MSVTPVYSDPVPRRPSLSDSGAGMMEGQMSEGTTGETLLRSRDFHGLEVLRLYTTVVALAVALHRPIFDPPS